ncbi:MAG: type I methionyl aminopeptidase [Vampirovibrionales bacterium]
MMRTNMGVPISKKSRQDLKLMRVAGRIVAEVHALMREICVPGITTLELDQRAEAHIRTQGAVPTFKGYYGFPATLCVSVNDEVVHGIPGARVIQPGDIVSVDCGATYKGMVADSAYTVQVGEVPEDWKTLCRVTEESLYNAIAQMVPGNFLDEVSGAVEDTGKPYGYGLVKHYGGHGVGFKLHEDPFVPNYRTGTPGPVLRSGNCLAIEPMFTMGVAEVYTAEDEWTVLTKDGKPAAHFEHTIAVTDDGPEILTKLPV